MKKTIHINIGRTAFILDEDAYTVLKKYLEEIELRFDPPEGSEVLEDIEMRISDIFAENLSSFVRVVDINLVNRAISLIGEASEFGEPVRRLSKNTNPEDRLKGRIKRHYRSRTEKLLGGVCGGIADYYELDPLIVRIITILITLFTAVPLLLYVICWIIMPLEPLHIMSGTNNRTKPYHQNL